MTWLDSGQLMLPGWFHAPLFRRAGKKMAYGPWGWAEGAWNDLVNSPVELMLAEPPPPSPETPLP